MGQGSVGLDDAPPGRPGKRLGGDADLRAELRRCAALGVSHTAFLSWTTADQDKALALVEYDAQFCGGGCGTMPQEWDPTQGGNRFAYIVDVWRCPGCELLEMARRDLPEDQLGLHMRLVPNDDLESMEA